MSQADQLLRILEAHPGRWVSTAELLREVPSVVHSRINDLRSRGVKVEHRTVGVGAKGSEYRLVSERKEGPCELAGRGSNDLALTEGEDRGPRVPGNARPNGTALGARTISSPSVSALTEGADSGSRTGAGDIGAASPLESPDPSVSASVAGQLSLLEQEAA